MWGLIYPNSGLRTSSCFLPPHFETTAAVLAVAVEQVMLRSTLTPVRRGGEGRREEERRRGGEERRGEERRVAERRVSQNTAFSCVVCAAHTVQVARSVLGGVAAPPPQRRIGTDIYLKSAPTRATGSKQDVENFPRPRSSVRGCRV